MTEAIITALCAAVIGLASYIFISAQKSTSDRFKAQDDRFRHTETLIEEVVKSNSQLTNLIKDNNYRLSTVENKLKIKIIPRI